MMSIDRNSDLITSNRMAISLNSAAIANPLVTSNVLASIVGNIAANRGSISTSMINISSNSDAIANTNGILAGLNQEILLNSMNIAGNKSNIVMN